MKEFVGLILCSGAWAIALCGESPPASAGSEGLSEPGVRVLLLGDSHSLGPFGEHLDRALRDEGIEVYTFAAGAGSPYYWLQKHQPISASLGSWEKTPKKELREEVSVSVPKVEPLLRSCRPQVVIVQAGRQLFAPLRLGTPGSREQVERVIDEFCLAVSEARAWIYWIDPPDAHPKRISPALRSELAELIREAVGRCQGRVFDSRAVTEWSLPYPDLSDGVHYGTVEARQWAEAVAADFLDFLQGVGGKEAPVVVAQPEEAKSRRNARPAVPIRARIIAPLGSPEASDELQVKLVLRRKTAIEDPGKIEGGSAFGLFEYEVEKVYQGTYTHERLRVAHLLLLNAQVTAPNRFEPGEEYYLHLVRMEKFPSLAKIPLVSGLEADEKLPVYICRF